MTNNQSLIRLLQAQEKLKMAGASDMVLQELQQGIIMVSDCNHFYPISVAPSEWKEMVREVAERNNMYCYHVIHDCSSGNLLHLLCFPKDECYLDIVAQLSNSGESPHDFFAYTINLADPDLTEPVIITVVSKNGVLVRQFGTVV